MNDATTRIDYDQVRAHAHRLRQEFIAEVFRHAARKLGALVAGSRRVPEGTGTRCLGVPLAD